MLYMFRTVLVHHQVAPDEGLIQSETCRASNEKINFNHRNLCIFLVYIHIVRTCQKSRMGIATDINSPHIKHGTVTDYHE